MASTLQGNDTAVVSSAPPGRLSAARGSGSLTWPVTVVATTVVVAVVGTGLVAAGHWPQGIQGQLGAVLASGFLPVGVFLLRHRPGHRLSVLVWLVGVLAGCGLAGGLWEPRVAAAWVGQWTWWPALALIPMILIHFPAGLSGAREARWLARGLGVSTVLSTVLLAGAAAFAPRTLLTDVAVPVAPAATWMLRAAAVAGAGTLLLALAVLGRLVVSAKRSRGLERRQYLCLLPTLVLLLAGIAADVMRLSGAVMLIAALALPIGIAVAVMQFQFEDLDLVVHRGVVWLTLTVLLTGAWAGLLLLIDPISAGEDRLVALVLLAGLIVALDPIRRRVERATRRWLFGRRDEPLALLAGLGRRLADASTPVAVLETTVSELAIALKVPYAAIVLTMDGRDVVVAEAGRTGVPTITFGLAHDGGQLGSLRVSPRRAGERFTGKERQVLDEIARQASVAAHAHFLTLQVQQSRDRIVRAREVERLRLRRDLHDGLGPLLAGARMQLSAVARQHEARGGEAVTLRGVLAGLGAAGETVRGIIDDLRPPALDAGFVCAARELVDTLLPDLRTDLVTDSVGQMAPAVEVAAYRILAEALTNVARHSAADRCRVTVSIDGSLRLEIADDGTGLGGHDRDGVGLGSMRERAEELGGWVRIAPGPHGRGTTVTASLPLGTCGNVVDPPAASTAGA